jgi:hypothetical protein
VSDPSWVPYVAVAGLVVAVSNTGVTLYDRLAKRRALAIDEWRPLLTKLRDVAARVERDPVRPEEEREFLRHVEKPLAEMRERTNDPKLLAATRNLGESAKWLALLCPLPGGLEPDVETLHDARTQGRELREATVAALARLAAVERRRG